MRIALPSRGSSLDAPVSPAFGRCQFFLFVDTESGHAEAIPNPYEHAERDAGVQAAQLAVDHGVEAVITPLIGQYAQLVLEEAGVTIYELELESGQSVLEHFRSGRLEAFGVDEE
jgi:predicted Fe-Mo cluster-binding NifX family protein